uniref:(northern house mosquito) hypothetical protein n=1 Tax=Culex pipiens TaxID=7175 RepID=A0A8D8FD34_CULPI
MPARSQSGKIRYHLLASLKCPGPDIPRQHQQHSERNQRSKTAATAATPATAPIFAGSPVVVPDHTPVDGLRTPLGAPVGWSMVPVPQQRFPDVRGPLLLAGQLLAHFVLLYVLKISPVIVVQK